MVFSVIAYITLLEYQIQSQIMKLEKEQFRELFIFGNLQKIKSYITERKMNYEKLYNYLECDPLLSSFSLDNLALVEYLLCEFRNEISTKVNFLNYVFSAEKNSEAIIDLLLQYGFSPTKPLEIIKEDCASIYYIYPAYYVVFCGDFLDAKARIKILEKYKSHGADFNRGAFYVNLKSINKNNGVDYSTESERLEHHTVLWAAVMRKDIYVVKYLIDNMVEIDVRLQNKTVLEWALLWRQQCVDKLNQVWNDEVSEEERQNIERDIALYDEIIAILKNAKK